ncbi:MULTISPECIES: ABCB family ABC transporter ATP-binding protein/permease [unclassified Marinobacter]|uniref:ABCB family ABC transporter ATP-binding protein/permease n=1 Tax=unclassified Marinobacter TaxID=83889 RepID=UPI001268EA37|nr:MULTISPECIES: ABC transporter ATP-binding protein/permease [unclassified Marinobacter]QFS85226.1 Putative multidrug export ATP-binding/permease protein [Marinobacter sp. THAF197a]QFT49020.1 Putative multidrug export ATP-binding/permease protein [Marinobacter sp. THAF39]
MRAYADNDYPADHKPDWSIISGLWPYLLEFRGRVALAMAMLVLAKLATVATPVALKYIVDYLDQNRGADMLLWIPVVLVVAYGSLRFGATLFSELRDAVFARVAERAMRRVSLRVFEHLHQRELGFHLDRKTGGLARDIERGTNGISFLLRFTLFNIVPTILEILLVAAILLVVFNVGYVLAILVAVVVYVVFSIKITEWRTKFVREANARDNQSNSRAIDSLLNYETVKYFNNERYEAELYDQDLDDWEKARLKNRLSLATLNAGQALIIGVALIVIMAMAVGEVASGEITLGDFTMINAYLIQLFIPLNALGFVYREIRQALVNVERLFKLLGDEPEILDAADAKPLAVDNGEVRFEHIHFAYRPDRPILQDVNFTIPAGHTVAVVGASGAGKSTLARLLFRFYEVDQGAIRIDGQDIRTVTQDSLRSAIGVVPQDTVLFNDTLYRNLAYGRPEATEEEVYRAARMAHLEDFIHSLPEGYETKVGERGLKLSGGEKQRVAIARVILKNPPLLILDEATSSLDSLSEQAILGALKEVSQQRTTLVIAHRLSTIRDANTILVMDGGQIVESGSHNDLLTRGGHYAHLWEQQHRSEDN